MNLGHDDGEEDDGFLRTTSCGGVPWRVKDGRPQLLLIKQFEHKEQWGVPKGHLKEDETLEECARREIREEAGIEVVLLARLPDVVTKYRRELKTVCSWLARPTGDDEPRHDDPDSEVADARWFDLDALPPVHAYQRELIEGVVKVVRSIVPTT